VKIIRYTDSQYQKEVELLVNRSNLDLATQDSTVREIINAVKSDKDEALLRYTNQFDRCDYSLDDIRDSEKAIQQAYTQVTTEEVAALKIAAENIRRYHQKQMQESWQYKEDGVTLGQMVRPLQTVGIYVPGGKASYPSSVLMNAIPAKVAGVERIVMCSPSPDGKISPHALVAADLAGVSEIYKVGGAQAVAAMAFGTPTIPKVDKIVGPGNIYVALAKRLVYGIVDIDMIAGPSEILIIADDSANPDYVASDLLAQAEHDEEALPVMITCSDAVAEKVQTAIEIQKNKLKRQEIIEVSLKNGCKLFVVESLQAAIDLANRIAPEHLELAVEEPARWMEKINNAGAVFLGHYTPEAIGDYLAGPNHVLPTSGTARFSSPLGVYDFIKKTSIISYTQEALKKNGPQAVILAEMEHLDAHANSVRIRIT
jgi:histidinol dehydrogenase